MKLALALAVAAALAAGGLWLLFRGAADAPVSVPHRQYEPHLDGDLAEDFDQASAAEASAQ